MDRSLPTTGDMFVAAVSGLMMFGLVMVGLGLAQQEFLPGYTGSLCWADVLALLVALHSARATARGCVRRREERRRMLRESRLAAGVCPNRTYNLAGLQSRRCPECGEPVGVETHVGKTGEGVT